MKQTKQNKQTLENLLSQMTLDEKLAQLGSCWVFELQDEGVLDEVRIKARLGLGIGQITRVAGASTLGPREAAIAANRLQKFLLEQTRLGIPAILHEESCSGAMLRGGSIFPQMIGLASTFQPELAEKMTRSIRSQLLAIGARQTLAPVLDVARDPRWGRIEETFGEDPTLVSHFGLAYVRGLQGGSLSRGVIATGKHFIGHSLSQAGQNCAPVQIGKHELYDVFLAPFQAAIRDAGLASIMNSYPELDGEVVAASRHILTDLLRGELGFDGFVVSDYEAVSMIYNFHYSADGPSMAGSMALNAGIDVELPTSACYGAPLKAAIDSGDLDIDVVDTAVRRHLQKKFDLGLFENPFVDEGRVLEVFETPDQRSLAREIAIQSMVLLKNDGLLPLKKDIRTLAVIGPNADDQRNLLGDYSYAAVVEMMAMNPSADPTFAKLNADVLSRESPRITSILEGIRSACSPGTTVLYARGCDCLDRDKGGFDEALQVARQADAVILVLGDRSGLTPLCTTGETCDSASLQLPGMQEDLARLVSTAGKPVTVVLVTGRPYSIPWLDKETSAILEAWLPGEEGGSAVASVLFGDANPGGRLPVTFPRHVGQIPIFYNHKPSGMKSHWYGDYVSEKAAPLYCFGHGLSYTRFEYRDLSLSQKMVPPGSNVDISVRIINTGKVRGDEVPQLYICDEIASSPRPVKELKGYARLSLDPGESQTVTFHLAVDQLAFFNLDLELVLEPGRMLVMVGSSSDDIRLRDGFEITEASRIPMDKRVFICPVTIK